MRRYDWDADKEALNVARRGISFEEAESVLDRSTSMTTFDLSHSDDEPRFLTIDWSNRGRLLVVVTSEGGLRPRIISARRATKRERDDFARR